MAKNQQQSNKLVIVDLSVGRKREVAGGIGLLGRTSLIEPQWMSDRGSRIGYVWGPHGRTGALNPVARVGANPTPHP